MLTFSTITFAQSVSNQTALLTNNNKPTFDSTIQSNNPIDESKKIELDYSSAHNQSAINQLQNHFTDQIKYSEIMAKNCLEGTMNIKIYLSEDGSIQNVRVSKNANSELVSAVKKASDSFNKVNINEPLYQGSHVFLIPINFSMEH